MLLRECSIVHRGVTDRSEVASTSGRTHGVTPRAPQRQSSSCGTSIRHSPAVLCSAGARGLGDVTSSPPGPAFTNTVPASQRRGSTSAQASRASQAQQAASESSQEEGTGASREGAAPASYAQLVSSEEFLDGVHHLDVLDKDRSALQAALALEEVSVAAAVAAAEAEAAEVPGGRIIRDPVELDLVGQGLPIIQGGEWPDVYWAALSQLQDGGGVELPRPHPKFSMQDMERIATDGPRFADVVLEHVESNATVDEAEAYRYVPATVLGDWRFATEPSWLDVPQMNFYSFYQGIRERNWTGKQYVRSAEPWQLQMFHCDYAGVSGWPGWRAVVTCKQSGDRFWVDMPEAGALTLPGQQSVSDVGLMGYRHVLQQLYQAYEQRLTPEAQHEMQTQGYVPPGRYAYDCPGEVLLDVSYHTTGNALTTASPLTRWLISPSVGGALRTMKAGMLRSGIFELKELRDKVCFHLIPDLPTLPRFQFDASGAGPFYFVVCMVLGIVLPAIKRSKILDIRALEEDMGAAQEFARSKADARKEGLTGVQFQDVAGLDPILDEITEVVQFLKDPKSYKKLGAKPPKGILLEGDPGTGKTLLAKALAGEAVVPFYQMSGTEFTEGIVGVGAGRVRDLFKRAAANAPCLIFVDELDAIGLKRASTGEVANEEREQTLNQLLTALDGFNPDSGVVFIGATNRADRLDPALLRPGRFDRKVHMPKPDTEGRYHILRLNLRNKKVEPDVDLHQLARDLPGLVGADLANVVNEAQLNAARDKRTMLTAKDLYVGVDRFTQGEKRQPLPTSSKLPVLCYAAREVGTALVAARLRGLRDSNLPRIEEVERVSIQPKGRSLSRTFFARGTDEEYQVMTRGKLLDRIKVALAGSIAVRIVLGEDTNFAAADIKRACYMAQKLVFYYSMSDLGITTWAKQPYSPDFFTNGARPRKVVSTDAMDAYADWPTRLEDFRFDPLDPSDPTWHRYTDEVRRIIKTSYEEVWAVLQSQRTALWAGVQALSEQKEMLGGELRNVFDRHPTPLGSVPPALPDMQIFTKGGGLDRWPYGAEWLRDACPTPHWAKVQAERDAEAAAAASAAAVATAPVR